MIIYTQFFHKNNQSRLVIAISAFFVTISNLRQNFFNLYKNFFFFDFFKVFITRKKQVNFFQYYLSSWAHTSIIEIFFIEQSTFKLKMLFNILIFYLHYFKKFSLNFFFGKIKNNIKDVVVILLEIYKTFTQRFFCCV